MYIKIIAFFYNELFKILLNIPYNRNGNFIQRLLPAVILGNHNGTETTS